jgi:hypothetical protein
MQTKGVVMNGMKRTLALRRFFFRFHDSGRADAIRLRHLPVISRTDCWTTWFK